MRSPFRIVLSLVFSISSPLWSAAQYIPGQPDMSPQRNITYLQKLWIVAGIVKTMQGEPVRNAVVTVTPFGVMGAKMLGTNSQGEFRTEYSMVVEEFHAFSAIVAIKKKGFHTAHSYINFGESNKTWWLPFTLYELKDEDPNCLPMSELVAGLAPRLRQLGPADGLPAKGARDYARGVADFLERHQPERAIPDLWKVAKENPNCIGCRTMLALAELDWHAWDDARETLAEAGRDSLANQQIGRPEPLIAYGTWLSWQNDAEKALPFFVEAVKFGPQDPLALEELGRALVATQQLEAATEYLKKALAAGAGSEAKLLYIESCLGTGHFGEATSEMNRYLAGRDVKTMPLRVRKVWVDVQNREKLEAAYTNKEPQKGRYHFDFLQNPPHDMIDGLEPALDQAQLEPILTGVAANISAMFANFPNTSSRESIHQEKIGGKGKVRGSKNQEFRYLCMAPRQGWGPTFKEYRVDSAGTEIGPKGVEEGYMVTRGFNAATLVFHPDYRSETTFRYLGRQQTNGHVTYVVAFAQIPSKAHLRGLFKAGQSWLPTFSQGLAWIDPSSYQIVRLRTELLRPLPELRLERESTEINFSQVGFKRITQTFWLPQQVTVAINWDGKQLRNTHEYSDFRLFSVDATEKVGKPKREAAVKSSTQPTSP